MRYSLLPALALLTACASEPPANPSPTLAPDLAEARRLLLASGSPIPIEIDAAPVILGSDPRGAVANAASAATQWAAASFTPSTASSASTRLAFAFGDSQGPAVCTGNTAPALMSMAPSRVRAVMCDGNRVVAEAIARSQGSSAEEVEAMVTQATERLFPPLREQTTADGWTSVPGVRLGGWVGSGGHSGIGGGLGF